MVQPVWVVDGKSHGSGLPFALSSRERALLGRAEAHVRSRHPLEIVDAHALRSRRRRTDGRRRTVPLITTTGTGRGGTVFAGSPAPPDFWADAGCLGQRASNWTIDRSGNPARLAAYRRICAQCPVSGPCLRDAQELDELQRRVGPVRCGTTGVAGWRTVEKPVAQLEPTTDEDSSAAAAVVLGEGQPLRSVA